MSQNLQESWGETTCYLSNGVNHQIESSKTTYVDFSELPGRVFFWTFSSTVKMGMQFEYDEEGGTFFYFLLSFWSLVLIPATYYLWPRTQSPGNVVSLNLHMGHTGASPIHLAYLTPFLL